MNARTWVQQHPGPEKHMTTPHEAKQLVEKRFSNLNPIPDDRAFAAGVLNTDQLLHLELLPSLSFFSIDSPSSSFNGRLKEAVSAGNSNIPTKASEIKRSCIVDSPS
jgi:hypothetical protein